MNHCVAMLYHPPVAKAEHRNDTNTPNMYEIKQSSPSLPDPEG